MNRTDIEEALRAIAGFTVNTYQVSDANVKALEEFSTVNNFSFSDVIDLIGMVKNNIQSSNKQITRWIK